MGLAFRKCDIVGAVISKGREEILFTHHKIPGHAGIVGKGDLCNQLSSSAPKMTEKRCTVSMKEILPRFNAPSVIDYFSLNVEGAEEMVPEAFPFEEYKILTLSVKKPSTNVKSLLAKDGLKFYSKAHVDEIWVHSSLAL